MKLRQYISFGVFSLTIACCLVPNLTFSQRIEALQTFTSPRFGFSLEYPLGWSPTILGDVFYIENFPPAKAVRAVRLPEGSAGIRILAASQIVKDGHEPATLNDLVCPFGKRA